MRTFIKNHLFKVVIAIVVFQLACFAWLQNKNGIPQAEADEFNIIEGRTSKLNVLVNDKDKDEEDVVFIAKFSKPANGTLIQKKDYIEYKAKDSFVGWDSLWYTISDGKNESEKATIRINVKANAKPEAREDEKTIFPFETATIAVLENDSDPERDSIFIQDYSQPLYGKITLQPSNRTLNYTPLNLFKEVDSLTYTISDGKNSATATVRIKVRKPDGHVFSSISNYNKIEDYRFRNSKRWNIIKDGGNDRLAITVPEYGTPQQLRLGEYALVKNKKTKGDFILTLNAKSIKDLEKTEWPDFAVVFAFEDDMNYCFAYFSGHKPQDGATGIYRVENGKRRTIAHGGQAFSDNNYHAAKVVRKGNVVTVLVDEKELVSANDKSLGREGLVGFGSQDDGAYFDDFKVVENGLKK